MKSKDPAFQLGYFYGENTLLLFWDLRSVTLLTLLDPPSLVPLKIGASAAAANSVPWQYYKLMTNSKVSGV